MFSLNRHRLMLIAACAISSCHHRSRPSRQPVSLPVLEHHHVFHAGDVRVIQGVIDVFFSGMLRPARMPSSAVITSFALESTTRPATASGRSRQNDRVHGADARAGQHGDRGFRHHRHVDRHTSPFFTPRPVSTLAKRQTSACSSRKVRVLLSLASSPSQIIAG